MIKMVLSIRINLKRPGADGFNLTNTLNLDHHLVYGPLASIILLFFGFIMPKNYLTAKTKASDE